MTCKDFEKMIPAFLGKKQDFASLKSFMKHMETCNECHEELKIQFLVTEGMQRLEEGNAFDMQSELEARLEEARSRMRYHSVFLYLGAGLETLAAVALVGIILWLVI